jgi:type II secretory pathway component PulF
MPHFTYRALNAQGQICTASIEAENHVAANARLESRQLTPLRIKRCYFPDLSTSVRRPTDHLLSHWCKQLSALLKAGITLDEALDDLQLDTSTHHPAFTDLGHLLREGKSLSDALGEQNNSLDSGWIRLIAAGEHAGHLPETLQQLGEHLDWLVNEQSQTRQSLIQPLLSAMSVFVAVIFLLLYLAPQLQPIFAAQTLPLSTVILFWVTDTLKMHGNWVFAGGIFVGLLVWLIHRIHPQSQVRIDQLRLRLPIIGLLHFQQQLARYTHTWGLLYQNGIPMLEAMQESRSNINNSALHSTLTNAENLVSTGLQARAAFERASPFSWPTPTLRMLHHGEKTGDLASAIQELSVQLQQRHQQTSRQINSLLQPAVTVGSGLLLAWVAMALLSPLYGQLSQGLH